MNVNRQSNRKKIGVDVRWVFRLSIFVGASYLLTRLTTGSAWLDFPLGLVALGVIGLIATSIIKHYRPDSFEYFSLAEVMQMKMPPGWRIANASCARFVHGRWGSTIFMAGWIVLCVSPAFMKGQKIFGFRLGYIVLGYFFGYILLTVIGSFLGWDELIESERSKRKLKPIPQRGKKVELYDFETGKPLAHISSSELEYLIDSFREWGMADNDFYIMRETVDLFEERSADPHLVATLREIMGEKHEIEIGWTLV